MFTTFLKSTWDRQDQVVRTIQKRKSMWMGILRDGKASLSDIMKADFGQSSPNGLNVSHWHGDTEIVFDITEEQKGFLGSVWFDEPERVCLHSMFDRLKNLSWFPLYGQAISMLSHEVIHSRQGFERHVGVFTLCSNFLHEAEPRNEGERQYSEQMERRTKFLSAGKYDLRGYLAEDVEMQARMHEAFAIAYHEWQVMPTTRTEFFAAMHCAGFQIPKSTLEALENSEDGQDALKRFELSSYTKAQMWLPVSLINQVYAVAEVCSGNDQLWEDRNAFYYGSLLDLYGDQEGIARMFPQWENRRHVIEVLHAIKQGNGDKNTAEVADGIPSVFSAYFLNGLKYQNQPHDFISTFEDAFESQGKLPDWYERLEV